MRPLELGHLKEDYPVTMFFENQRFSRFFLQTEQYNSRFNHAYLTSRETTLIFLNVIGAFAKKAGESVVFKNRCDWIIFFQVNLVPVVAM